METPKYKYPFLECSHHPGRQRCYISCRHILDGSPPASVVLADDDEPGELLCAECVVIPIGMKNIDDFAPICEGCALDRGLLLTI